MPFAHALRPAQVLRMSLRMSFPPAVACSPLLAPFPFPCRSPSFSPFMSLPLQALLPFKPTYRSIPRRPSLVPCPPFSHLHALVLLFFFTWQSKRKSISGMIKCRSRNPLSTGVRSNRSDPRGAGAHATSSDAAPPEPAAAAAPPSDAAAGRATSADAILTDQTLTETMQALRQRASRARARRRAGRDGGWGAGADTRMVLGFARFDLTLTTDFVFFHPSTVFSVFFANPIPLLPASFHFFLGEFRRRKRMGVRCDGSAWVWRARWKKNGNFSIFSACASEFRARPTPGSERAVRRPFRFRRRLPTLQRC